MRGESEILRLWKSIYRGECGYLSLGSGYRARPGDDNEDFKTQHFDYPRKAEEALQWLAGEARRDKEVYFCAHLLKKPRRLKEHAAAIASAYADGDDAKVPDHIPQPSIVVETSQGRYQYYWPLSRSLEPEEGEQLNKRIAYAISADKSGWDLTQLMRPPGTVNHKYESTPSVVLLECSDRVHDPDELASHLPHLPKEATKPSRNPIGHSPENSETTGERAGGHTDHEIRDRLRRARRSKGSSVFRKLHDAGEIDGYKSSSEARMALMGKLAYWFPNDETAMVKVFKQSALWKKHEREERLLWNDARKAIANCTKPYDPNYRTKRDEREQLRLELLSQALELPWRGQGGPMEWAIYCSLINTGGEYGEVSDEGLSVCRSLTDLALDVGTSKPDTVRGARDRLEDKGLIRRLGQRTGRDAERYLLLKPTHHRVIEINPPLSLCYSVSPAPVSVP